MTLRGQTYEGTTKSRNTDCGITPEFFESRASPHRKIPTSDGAKLGIASNTSVHKLLECSICTHIMYPPILQCPNGHTFCSKCQSKVCLCPICYYELGNIRCLALERVAESLEMPCRYQIVGCHDILSYNSRLRHEQIVSFVHTIALMLGQNAPSPVISRFSWSISGVPTRLICMMGILLITDMSSLIFKMSKMLHGCSLFLIVMAISSVCTLRLSI